MPKIRGIKPDLWTDENFVELSPYARLLWIGLWNYACDNGHLQDKSKQIKMRVLPTDDVNCADLLREIEGQGLIHRADGWINIPNLTHHQKPHKRWFVTCDKLGCELPEGASYGYSKRESTVEQPLTNESTTVNNGGSTADGDVDGDGDGDLMVKEDTSADADEAPKDQQLALVESRPDVDHICEHLAGAIEANGSKRPTITTKWRQAARLMLDKDGRSIEEVHGAIEWCQRDEFWRANVLSLPTLREKYDTLRLQAQRKSGSTSKAEEWRSMQERQMARAVERERQMGINS